jgi:hypothetical protein
MHDWNLGGEYIGDRARIVAEEPQPYKWPGDPDRAPVVDCGRPALRLRRTILWSAISLEADRRLEGNHRCAAIRNVVKGTFDDVMNHLLNVPPDMWASGYVTR